MKLAVLVGLPQAARKYHYRSAEVVSSAARAAQVAAEHSSTTAPWQQARKRFCFFKLLSGNPSRCLRPPLMAFGWWWRQPRLRASRRPQNVPKPSLGRVLLAVVSRSWEQDAEKLQKVQEKAEELSPEKQKAGPQKSLLLGR